MKLSPPASSSDLETARQIARRLHQRRRRDDRPGAPERPPALSPPPLPSWAAPAPAAPLPSPPPAAAPLPPDLPSWDEPAPEVAPPGSAGLDSLEALGEPAPAPDAGELPGVDVEDLGVAPEEGVSPEEMVGVGEPPLEDLPAPEAPGGPPSSPFDVELDEGTAADDFVEAPAPPSWDDIVEACLGIARSKGAMLVDPAGQVFASRGEWPSPGPDAIAAKLVTTMERTLKDAPMRAISAPLMGSHLTAWRVALPEGLVTAAFIGSSPVHAEARPAIDAEIHRGVGA